jgi:methionyl-tRNA formyltransferase
VFAYHTIGARALAALLARGETVAAVATGQGALRLTRVQQAGLAEESADRWAEARGLGPGDRLTGER